MGQGRKQSCSVRCNIVPIGGATCEVRTSWFTVKANTRGVACKQAEFAARNSTKIDCRTKHCRWK